MGGGASRVGMGSWVRGGVLGGFEGVLLGLGDHLGGEVFIVVEPFDEESLG